MYDYLLAFAAWFEKQTKLALFLIRLTFTYLFLNFCHFAEWLPHIYFANSNGLTRHSLVRWNCVVLTPDLYCKSVSFFSSSFSLLPFLGQKVNDGYLMLPLLLSDPRQKQLPTSIITLCFVFSSQSFKFSLCEAWIDWKLFKVCVQTSSQKNTSQDSACVVFKY